MNSRIYTGTIEHRRFTPVDHRLCYPIYMYALDVDELPLIDQWFPFFGVNRFGVSAIHNKDYLSSGNQSIKQKLNQLFDQYRIDESIISVIMVTSARYFNYVFNPVNFYYCFSKNKALIGIVAEVNNTYGERHHYVLTKKILPSKGCLVRYTTPKVFHVSPFNQIEGNYDFCFSDIGEQLDIRITLVHKEKKIMEAVLKARANPLTRKNHFKTLLKHPFAPHLSIPRIYTHAYKLYFQKKLTFNPKPAPANSMTLSKQKPGLIESICQKILVDAFKKITIGCLTMRLPNGKTIRFCRSGGDTQARIDIKDFGFFPRVVMDGEIGFGEAYMHGEWETPDLVKLLEVLIHNRDKFSDGNLFTSILTRTREKLAHDQRKNTIKNTRQNIAAHYDFSNEFYQLFLDRQMIYSSGIFRDATASLEDAQIQKMTKILEMAGVDSTHHLLEIGCGWGGFAVFAAASTGCRVTGITVSKAQYEKACQRVEKEGLTGRVNILFQDYRHTKGVYDRIVSIEMIEAVGPQFLGQYFQQCCKLLKPGGTMVCQAITIPDERYDTYCRQRDWIQKHIFPGGHLPCLKVLNDAISQHTDFKITVIDHIGLHYAKTLAHWRDRFISCRQDVEAMGFDRAFIRKWIYYLSICEAGFKTSAIDGIQMAMHR
ncbi:DUF1365 family protein [Desulfobacula toluolica]|nr:DUF1365 family protein [Desulfobacula toluolica]